MVHLLNSSGKQGLVHISEVSWKRLETMEGVLNEGDR